MYLKSPKLPLILPHFTTIFTLLQEPTKPEDEEEKKKEDEEDMESGPEEEEVPTRGYLKRQANLIVEAKSRSKRGNRRR